MEPAQVLSCVIDIGVADARLLQDPAYTYMKQGTLPDAKAEAVSLFALHCQCLPQQACTRVACYACSSSASYLPSFCGAVGTAASALQRQYARPALFHSHLSS